MAEPIEVKETAEEKKVRLANEKMVQQHMLRRELDGGFRNIRALALNGMTYAQDGKVDGMQEKIDGIALMLKALKNNLKDFEEISK